MSKANEIKSYLLSGKSITGRDAFILFGVYRLSSVINRLRKKRMNVITDMIDSYDGVRYAEYYLRKQQ